MTEIRMTHEDDPDATIPGEAVARRTPETDPEHLLPEHAGAGVPGTIAASDDPDVVRDEIERTRARMSQTIDSIESALLRKKEEIEVKLDVTAPVRERVNDQPWLYAGGVFAGGLLLGYLTGGKDNDKREAEERFERFLSSQHAVPTMEIDMESGERLGGGEVSGRSRSSKQSKEWEQRARELRRTCERQEQEIRSLRAALNREDREHLDYEERGLMGAVSDGLSGVVAGTVSRMMGSGTGSLDVEVDLEQPNASSHPYYSQPAAGYPIEGEMEVEVDLEPAHGTPHPYYTQPRTERYYDRAEGEMQVEVELEKRRSPMLLGTVGIGIAAALAATVSRLLTERHAEEEMVVEVDLESRPRPVSYTRPVAEFDSYGTEGEMLYERPVDYERPEETEVYRARPRSRMEAEVDLEAERGYDSFDRPDGGYGPTR
jgi:hypothetical protein